MRRIRDIAQVAVKLFVIQAAPTFRPGGFFSGLLRAAQNDSSEAFPGKDFTHSHPFARAIRAASTRLLAPSLLMASER